LFILVVLVINLAIARAENTGLAFLFTDRGISALPQGEAVVLDQSDYICHPGSSVLKR
jgi:hypothetical protein